MLARVVEEGAGLLVPSDVLFYYNSLVATRYRKQRDVSSILSVWLSAFPLDEFEVLVRFWHELC